MFGLTGTFSTSGAYTESPTAQSMVGVETTIEDRAEGAYEFANSAVAHGVADVASNIVDTADMSDMNATVYR